MLFNKLCKYNVDQYKFPEYLAEVVWNEWLWCYIPLEDSNPLLIACLYEQPAEYFEEFYSSLFELGRQKIEKTNLGYSSIRMGFLVKKIDFVFTDPQAESIYLSVKSKWIKNLKYLKKSRSIGE